jgi:hypothetical protein
MCIDVSEEPAASEAAGFFSFCILHYLNRADGCPALGDGTDKIFVLCLLPCDCERFIKLEYVEVAVTSFKLL